MAIIGAGHAGWSALRQVRKRTDSHVLISPGWPQVQSGDDEGMPLTALLESAHACHRIRALGALGVDGCGQRPVSGGRLLSALRALRDETAEATRAALADLTARHLIEGVARLVGPNHVMIDGQVIEARAIVVAGGSNRVIPDAWQPLADDLLTTDGLTDLAALPESVAVIGLGSEGLAVAQALQRLGVRVDGFDKNHLMGGVADPDVAGELRAVFEREFPVTLGHEVDVERCGSGFRVSAGRHSVMVDRVWLAVGHRPHAADLGWHRIGARTDAHGIPLHDASTLRVPGSSIFLAGEARGTRSGSQRALVEGQVAGHNAIHRNLRGVPRSTSLKLALTDPQLARAGERREAIDPARLVEVGVRFGAAKHPFAARGRHGMLKLYADRKTRVVLGGEMIGPDSAHMAHLLAMLVHHGLSVEQALSGPYRQLPAEKALFDGLSALRGKLSHRCSTTSIARIDARNVGRNRDPAARE